MELKLFKLKKGKEGAWFAWCLLLMTTYKKQALKSLKEEGLLFEASGSFKLNGEIYVLGMYHSKNKPNPTNLEREVNKRHREMKKEC